MARWNIAGVCMVAALAVGVMASATASAEPEFLTKAVVKEGESIPFSGTVGASFFEAKSGTKITCTSGTITGEVTGPNSVGNTVVNAFGCESGGGQCENGPQNKEIHSEVLAGVLGGITSTLPGLKLFSEADGKGGVAVQFKCGNVLNVIVKGEVTGSVAGAAGAGPETGKLVASLKLKYVVSGGIQKYKGFSEGPEAGLMGQLAESVGGGAYEPAGWSMAPNFQTVPSTWEIGVTK
jgi:hypothetical protein